MFPGGNEGGGQSNLVALLLVGLTVLMVTLFAAYIPARRASLVDPTRALRYE